MCSPKGYGTQSFWSENSYRFFLPDLKKGVVFFFFLELSFVGKKFPTVSLGGLSISFYSKNPSYFVWQAFTVYLIIVYSSSFGAFSSSISLSFIFVNSVSLGTILFQNAILSASYLRSTLGFKSRTRYACYCSVNAGHVTGVEPESGGFGDLVK